MSRHYSSSTWVRLHSARPSPEARRTRNARNPLPDFCEGLSVGENIIVRVSNDEKDENPDEEYFVAKIEEKAKQLEEEGVYSDVLYKKNDWIVYARWYAFSKTNDSGDRFYTKGFPQWIPCGSIIRTLTQSVTLNWCGNDWKLESSLNSHIEKHGNICDLFMNFRNTNTINMAIH